MAAMCKPLKDIYPPHPLLEGKVINMSNNKRQRIGFCLIITLLFVLIIRLSVLSTKLEQRVNLLQHNLLIQSTEMERSASELENMASAIDDIYLRYDSLRNDFDTFYEANQIHENCVAMAVLINSESVLADEYGRTEEEQDFLYGNDRYFAQYYGRLYVPDAKIDVALYYSISQYVCDRQDSANIFIYGLYDGEYIADHNNQEFRKLFSVEVGMQGYIQLANGDIINIECIDVLNGHHTGRAIVDENGNSALDGDYLMYTCRNGWQNIRICLWDRY